MKCPGCGKEIPDDSLYCEHCGEDIHIVPDFEPEIELNIEQTISELVGKLYQQKAEKRKEEPKKHRHTLKWLVTGAVIVVALGIFGLWMYQYRCYHSVEFQVKRAVAYQEQAEYEKAIDRYKRALELRADDTELLFGLAEVYFLENNKTEYESVLWKIVSGEEISTEQLERAYAKIIAIYRTKEDYQSIHDFLLDCEDLNVRETYRNYISGTPNFSLQEGYYTGVQPLKLTASGKGSIYYTLDGTQPTAESTLYTTPILLEDGEYTVKACFVSENGVPGEVVTQTYQIENVEIYAPEINLYSGEYYYPSDILVVGDSEDVYYTTDGSDPTYASNLYTGAIPLPVGRSVYKFARVVDGVTGNIAERTYRLELQTSVTTKDAVDVVVQYALDSGKIYDAEGYFDESGDAYCYEYQYVTNINEIGHFYIVAEIYRTAGGMLTKTGNDFAVDIYNKKIFKLHQDSGRTNLVELEIKRDSYEEE